MKNKNCPGLDNVIERLGLKKTGHCYLGDCPFCIFGKQNFSINTYNNRYFCFSCRSCGCVELLMDKLSENEKIMESDMEKSLPIRKRGRPKAVLSSVTDAVSS